MEVSDQLEKRTLIMCDIYDHKMTYFITGDGTAHIDIINIDSYDDPNKTKFNSFFVLMKRTCKKLSNDGVKKISQLASRQDYIDSPSSYSKFDVKIVNSNVIELSALPDKFTEAMAHCWGFSSDDKS